MCNESQHGLPIFQKMCLFNESQVAQLDLITLANGMASNHSKNSAIYNVYYFLQYVGCGYLGLTGYYREFVCRNGVIMTSLNNMLKKYSFVQSFDVITALKALKKIMLETLVLALLILPFLLWWNFDALDLDIRVILKQAGGVQNCFVNFSMPFFTVCPLMLRS